VSGFIKDSLKAALRIIIFLNLLTTGRTLEFLLRIKIDIRCNYLNRNIGKNIILPEKPHIEI